MTPTLRAEIYALETARAKRYAELRRVEAQAARWIEEARRHGG